MALTLREEARLVGEKALASGAQIPIATGCQVIRERGILFLIHHLSGLTAKKRARCTQERSHTNPFLPPDPELTVRRLSPTHLCVLNKFNVLAEHLLIITTHFEAQNDLLTADDFSALTLAMSEIPGLGFFNAGVVAGASQEHKHLQLVPTPLGGGTAATPIDAVLGHLDPGRVVCHAALPFGHRLCGLADDQTSPNNVPELHSLYGELLAACHITTTAQPYNFLITPHWMMVVPRRCEFYEGISVNSLGFAGSLLVPDLEHLERVRSLGPCQVLEHVAAGNACTQGCSP